MVVFPHYSPAASSMPYRVIVGLPRWQLSGPHVFATRLVRGLSDLGHDARILLTESGSGLVDETAVEHALPEGIVCDRLPAGADDSWGQRWEALERYLEERAPCFYLMLHDWRNNVVAPRLSRRVRLIGLVQADHDLEIDQAVRLGEWWDAIVAVSDPIHLKLASKVSYLAPRMTTIRNAVPALDSPPRKQGAGPLRVAYSGELRRQQKRLDDMIEVAHRLAGKGVDFRLTFFGDGPHRSTLEERAGDLTSRGLVEFAGRLDGDALLDALNDQHVFLLTSEFEGLSISLLEAMSRGCVPVVSRLASQSLVVREGMNGLVADVGDVDTFVRHLETLASDRAMLERMAQRAFETIAEGEYRTQDMLAGYVDLFRRIDASADRMGFVRTRRSLARPPRSHAGVSILPLDNDYDLVYAEAGNHWPDAPTPRRAGPAAFTKPDPVPLERCRVIVASMPGSISGVDVFSAHLVRGLRERGLDARLHGRWGRDATAPCGVPAGLPFDERPRHLDADHLGWPNRWRGMIEHLSRLAPCIYLPNYDVDFSCIAPQLPPGVHVVGIGHSDDPWHYEHLARIGHACDAIVGVSRAVTAHLGALAPGFAPRLSTIPYGIPFARGQGSEKEVRRPHDPHSPLRIIYTGRLVQRQKRALDIVAIARTLRGRGVPFEMIVVGDGDLRPEMERAAHDLILDRTLWFTGAQPNTSVLTLLASCDAFLMPSAFEGLSVGMLEAMSRGVVPVVSDIRSGVPDAIVSGENGLVAPVGDIAAFTDRLEWLWKHPADGQRLASAAIDTVAHSFTLEQMLDRYVELFRRVVAAPLPRPRGPIVPPLHLGMETTWSLWARRVAADPAASLRRVAARLQAGRTGSVPT